MSQRPVRPAPADTNAQLAWSGACCALLLAILAGCGNEAGDSEDPGTAADTSSSSAAPSEPAPSSETTPPASPSTTPTEGQSDHTSDSSTTSGGTFTVGETVEPGQALVVSASNVDGDTARRASALVNDRALNEFLATTDKRLADDVRAAVRAVQVPAGSTLFGAVVSVGCETPTAISWTRTLDGIEVTPELPKPGVQCLVPVTSVALFLVPT